MDVSETEWVRQIVSALLEEMEANNSAEQRHYLCVSKESGTVGQVANSL